MHFSLRLRHSSEDRLNIVFFLLIQILHMTNTFNLYLWFLSQNRIWSFFVTDLTFLHQMMPPKVGDAIHPCGKPAFYTMTFKSRTHFNTGSFYRSKKYFSMFHDGISIFAVYYCVTQNVFRCALKQLKECLSFKLLPIHYSVAQHYLYICWMHK